jgi:sugar phosphate isomerase/epimerase
MNVVMHLGFDMHYGVAGASRSTHEQFPDYYEQVLGEALAELKEYARGRARLCVENVGGFRYPPALVVLKRLLGGSLGLCLDTGHVGILPRERQRLELEFFEQHLTCLYHCHIHDNHGVRDEHLALGDGTLDLSRCFSMLERTDALLVLETRPKEEALRSRDFFERVAALKWMRPRSAAAGKSGRSHKQGGGQR